MSRSVGISVVVALLFGLAVGTPVLRSVAGEATPELITTDTLAYCHQLSARVDQLASTADKPPATVYDLAVAGRDMCEHGAIRGGILRLRSAIVQLLHPSDGAPARTQ